MKLNEIRDKPGARTKKVRGGRGIGSGLGKTSGKGGKGQTARSGVALNGFEGGQTPLIRRTPIRGFNHAGFHINYQIVNLADLAEFAAGTVVTPELLAEAGLIRKAGELVKVLGGGVLGHKLTVQAHKFSKSAEDKIKAKGGAVQLLKGPASPPAE